MSIITMRRHGSWEAGGGAVDLQSLCKDRETAMECCYRTDARQILWLKDYDWLSVCQVQLLTSLDGMPCHAMQPRATVTVTSASLGTIKSVCRCWWASSRCEDTAAGKPAEVLLTSKVFAKTAKQPWSAATELTQDRFCGSRIMIGCQSVRCSCWPHWMSRRCVLMSAQPVSLCGVALGAEPTVVMAADVNRSHAEKAFSEDLAKALGARPRLFLFTGTALERSRECSITQPPLGWCWRHSRSMSRTRPYAFGSLETCSNRLSRWPALAPLQVYEQNPPLCFWAVGNVLKSSESLASVGATPGLWAEPAPMLLGHWKRAQIVWVVGQHRTATPCLSRSNAIPSPSIIITLYPPPSALYSPPTQHHPPSALHSPPNLHPPALSTPFHLPPSTRLQLHSACDSVSMSSFVLVPGQNIGQASKSLVQMSRLWAGPLRKCSGCDWDWPAK